MRARVNATPADGRSQAGAGLVGQLRRQAYSRPTHDPTHWLLLLAADRLETSKSLLEAAVTPGTRTAVLRHFGRQARAYPRGFGAAALALGVLVLLAARRRWKC
jgi:hypothetical protein